MKNNTKEEKGISIKPIGDRVLVEPIEPINEDVLASGIIVPGKEGDPKHSRGVVVAAGPGRTSPDGQRIKMEVKVGDIVLYRDGFENEEVRLNGKKFLLTFETNLLAIETK